MLSLTKSCRGVEDEALVRWGEGSYCVRAKVRADDGSERTVELVCELSPRRRKAGFRNDVRIPVSHLVGELPTVTFLPEDLDLFRGPPSARRRLLDRLLCQVSPAYLQELVRYQRVLKQRNALLKHAASDSDLGTWEGPLAASGALITVARLELLETFASALAGECTALGLPWADVTLAYDRSGTARDVPGLQQQLLALLVHRRERDRILQSTTVGPHRDDWRVMADGRDIVVFASRGQERLVLLALLSLEVSFLEIKRGETPVVLLDDAFSELDHARGALVLPALKDVQVFLTSARDVPAPGGRTWHIINGSVREASVHVH